jgi:hypothetical protein
MNAHVRAAKVHTFRDVEAICRSTLTMNSSESESGPVNEFWRTVAMMNEIRNRVLALEHSSRHGE